MPLTRHAATLLVSLLGALVGCGTDADADGPVQSADTGDGTTTPDGSTAACGGCADGLRCDETGFCARPRAEELWVADATDPRSGAATPASYQADLGSAVPDVAPLSCEGSGQACPANFDCGADGACSAACDACGGNCSYQALTYAIRNHIGTDLLYAGTPAGGNHHPCRAAWGKHTEPPGDEHWVHNLEHGGVAFLHRCPEGCETELNQLDALTAAYDTGTWLSAPEPQLNSRFAVVAWGYRLETDCMDLPAFDAFYQAHEGHAPEGTPAPPPGQCM